jgi:glycosyltransferase involved in cell wall biosynthesis
MASLRILLVSSMWPGRSDPDYGVFVAQIARELERRGHDVRRAVVDHRGGSPAKQLVLARDALSRALRTRPDVIYAHYLAPAGVVAAAAAIAARAPLVLTAHGRDVRNLAERPAVRAASAAAMRRAAAVVAVSGWLRDQLVSVLPSAAAKTEVIDCGVDLERFAGRDQAAARAQLGLDDVAGPLVVFAGALDERKNVVRLRDAVLGLPDATLAVIGDGPLRRDVAASERVRVAGRVAHEEVPAWLAAADVVALPSLVEPFGQVLLEAMACERPVVATRVGGPPEFVPKEAGALVDPLDVWSIRAGIEQALALGVPNPAARRAAAEHDLVTQTGRIEALLTRVASGGP